MSELPLFRSAKPIETSFKSNAEIIIFSGDVNEFIAQVPDNSVALVVTSPPYNLGKEYENRVSKEAPIEKENGGRMSEKLRPALDRGFSNYLVILLFLTFISIAASVFMLFSSPGSQKNPSTVPNDWENPLVFSRNAEPPHCTLMPYETMEEALAGQRFLSPCCLMLNGRWKFHWVSKPADRPANFYQLDFDASTWEEIDVPGNWQLQGYDVPIYLNIPYPFPKAPPRIPHDHNPIGSYRTEFRLPEGWSGRQVFLHFDGVESAFYVWLNGKLVGYSQDSRTPAEFNITSFLQPARNTLRIRNNPRQR